jgi:DNA modification methylase
VRGVASYPTQAVLAWRAVSRGAVPACPSVRPPGSSLRQPSEDGHMKPWLELKIADLEDQRPAESDGDVHFVESLVEAVLEEYSSPTDIVLDPFAGFGTTLVVAERMGRRAIGVELLEAHANTIRGRLAGHAQVITGDARRLTSLVRGPVDLCLTSPPYMTAVDHPENPLNAYQTMDGDYERYLAEIGDIFRQVAELLRPGGHAVINVANLRTQSTITPLAWDVARAVSHHLTLRDESFLCWDRQPAGISGDYCLVFQRPE